MLSSPKVVHKQLQNTLWPDTDQEAVFANDRNLQDALAQKSLTAFLPITWEDLIVSSFYLAVYVRFDFDNRLRIVFQAACVFLDNGVKLLLLPYFRDCKVIFFPGSVNVDLLWCWLLKVLLKLQ